ncbi:ABC transporter permease [Lachnospiraceae bacterium MD1]|uniref:ABC transporter permease n=1 Tax=Variimorphobacter saccharofermentans TaxID=2755051 RepID=A0A839K3C8_9FIRM|nr:ABC transporter permease [Variimorphobacter saccharofermentans]MBB2184120.1 ABC transporter permease [Variimorphobacter saccharofermentans]
MYKIWRLAFADIRKSKGNSASLFIMFMIAALLMNAGLIIFLDFGNYFEKTVKELNTSNIYYLMPGNCFTEEVKKFVTENENISEIQIEESLWASGITPYNDKLKERPFLINDADHPRTLSKWKFVGDHLPVEDMSVYLPNVYHEDAGYQLNDEIQFDFQGKQYTFTIKGFTEDIYFSSHETGFLGIYLPHNTYQILEEELDGNYDATILFANLKEVNKEIEYEIKEMTGLESVATGSDIVNTLLSFDLEQIKMSRIMMAMMMAIMIVVFSIIIVVVCLIVVRFRISNSIEDDMTKIGTLKALGYTNRQIMISIAMQFTAITLIGSIVGICLSYTTPSIISDVFAQQSGLKWEQGFNGGICFITLLYLLIVVILVAYTSARRIKKLHPIIALRGGINTHSFRKNHVPLHKSVGSLPYVLALKSLLNNKRQGIMIAIILIAVSFTGSFAIVMFYNTTIDIKTFEETPGIEISNAVVVLNPELDNTERMNEIRSYQTVRKTTFIDEETVMSDKTEVRLFIMDDYAEKETISIYDGRYPIHENEIAISGYLTRLMDKKIGDNIELRIGDKKVAYLITGLTQGFYMNGLNASITTEGYRKLNPEFQPRNLQIYLESGANAAEFVSWVNQSFGDDLLYVTDMDKSIEEGVGIYTSIFAKVGITMLILTIAVVILVLYFVINSAVTRQKRELGIQKAIGFTTLQLMNQISISFVMPVVVGVLIGSIIGMKFSNPIMSVFQSGMGIMKANYIIKPDWVVLFGIGVVIVAYVTSMLVTLRIRKISAYSLVSE